MEHLGRTVAITLGRLASLNPESCSSCLKHIIKPWCISLRYISGTEEKSQAFRGLCAMIPHNPEGVIGSFDYLCEAFV